MVIRLPIVPPTATSQFGSRRLNWVGGKPRFFKSARQKDTEHTLRSLLLEHRPEKPMSGPVRVSIVFVWPHTRSTPKRLLAKTLPLANRPDLDNLGKALLDVMTQLQFWFDDGQIQQLSLSKWRAPEGELLIEVEPA